VRLERLLQIRPQVVKILQADREGKSPYDLDGQIRDEVRAILTELEKRI